MIREHAEDILIPSLIAALALLAHCERQDAELERAHYCEMVAAGDWQAYNGPCSPGEREGVR